jgi:hypothetical protein
MTDVLKAMFQTPDGALHETKAAATDHMRAPKIKEALMKLTENNTELSDWLVEHRELVSNAFGTGTIKRVTKSEKKKLDAAIDAVVASENKDFKFLIDNADAMKDSFRWPTVKRMDDAEKLAAAQEAINAEANNPDLAAWALKHKDEILVAYDAGKVKREVSAKAKEALAAYRLKMKEEKEARLAAEGAEAA